MKPIKLHDVIYGTILIEDEIIAKVFYTFEFQRLRRLKQLAGAEFIYPNAEHSRFSHCLGTYHVARQMYGAIVNKDQTKKLNDHDRVALLLAAMLHDVGHGPFSHLFELVHSIKHEHYSVEVITNEKTSINQILSLFDKKLPKTIASIIEGTHQITWLNQIISSQLDADRLDYLARDASNVGLTFGNSQLGYLLEQLEVRNDLLAFNSKAITSIEQFLIGRIQMYDVLYLNKKNMATSHNIKWLINSIIENRIELEKEFGINLDFMKAIENANKNKSMIDVSTYLEMDDQTMNSLFIKVRNSKNKIVSHYATNLLTGRRPEVYVYPKATTLPTNIVDILKVKKDSKAYEIFSETKAIYAPSSEKDAIHIRMSEYGGQETIKELSLVSKIISIYKNNDEQNNYIDKSFVIMKD